MLRNFFLNICEMSEREIQNVMEMLQHPNAVTTSNVSVQFAQSQLLTVQDF